MNQNAGPQMVSCENCQKVFKSIRTTGGKLSRFCSWACMTAVLRGPNAPNYRGSTGYWANHKRVRAARGPAKSYPCEHCGALARDWAVCHGQSGASPDDFMPLCRKCHIRYDGSITPPPHHSGEANPAAKLTAEQVREIRVLRGQVSMLKLAKTYGVSKQTIYQIWARKIWKTI